LSTTGDYTHELQRGLKELGRGLPETIPAFSHLHAAAMADGALASSTKELIAVAISVCDRCEPCIGYHLERALAAGATGVEVREALGVAVMMSGGPGAVYAARAGAILDEKLALLAV
jgi:AhpD family alkylhydroperoxidase